MTEKIGFIGAGNMGQAIINGLLTAGLYLKNEIIIYDVEPLVDKLTAELGIGRAASEADLVRQVDLTIIAVKPIMMRSVLSAIKAEVDESKVILSIAAGVTIETIANELPEGAKIIRVMPNTPALVGEGMSSLSINQSVTSDEQDSALRVFSSFGKVELVEEYLIDAVVGVSGSAPAYVYIFIEALADGAVLAGLPRAQAYQFAAQTVLGSAKMVLESGKHPAELKDMVCSPGGTTIAAVQALESGQFRATVMNAVVAAAKKNQELS
ncbi:pyrroline-5-carboxylate reductase [uncultured Vagococcus sp.]|uniref:pyrroline-5-carboxylate reductase n=1 Tax=uncultured Vagococcus sp. TaxID=189676 RepID=UPI0028D907E8|nr:pyrroline-5-carboxylate reductase [uncultured Vagococcus sp.]